MNVYAETNFVLELALQQDFYNQQILARLRAANCRLLTSFSDAAAFVDHNTREIPS